MSRRVAALPVLPSSPRIKTPSPSSRCSFAVRPLTLAIHVLAASGALYSMGWSADAHAQASPSTAVATSATRRYDIAAGPLSDVLTRFSGETGVYVVGASAEAKGKTSPGVHGTYSVATALRALLTGTGLQAVQQADGSYSLRPAPAGAASNNDPTSEAAVLPAVTVTATATDDAAERLNPPTTVGSKTPLTQREIPQTVSVITQEQIQDQNLWSVSDVLTSAPGITIAQQANNDRSTGDFVYSRGWQITNYNIDGVPTLIDTLPISSTAEYERVELLHGASGLYSGMGGAGGTINMVRKQPQKEYAFNSVLGAGTNNSYQGQVDVTGSLNQSGTLRGRGVVSWQRQGYDSSAYTKTGTFYGVLEADIAPQTTAQIGASYDASSGRPERSFPTYANGSFYKASRSDYHYPSWNRYTNDTSTIFANITHHFDNGWTAKFNASYLHTNWSLMRGFSSRAIDSDGNVRGFSVKGDGLSSQTALDAFVDGPFQLFGRTHHLTLGTNYLKENTAYNFKSVYWGSVGFSSLENLEPDYSDLLVDERDDARLTDYGVYMNARFSLADPLSLVLGGRLAWYKNNDHDDNTGDLSIKSYSYKNKLTPFAGLIYDINKNYSAYASYSTIYKPSSAKDKDGNMLKPLEGDQYEVGLKGSYLDGRANASVALFRGTQKNRAVADPDDPTGNYYIATGKARVQGVELLVSGEVLRGLTLSGGYTYLNTKMFDNNNEGSSFSTYAPKHMFKLWANYQLPGELHKWQVGGGATVISSQYVEGDGYSVRGPGYALFDASVGYQVNHNLRVDLSVKNLFNRYYWSTISGTSNGNYLGQGRSAMLAARFSY